METLFSEKPPWKSVEWVRSPSWATQPLQPTFSAWVTHINVATFEAKELIGALDKEHKWELAKKMVNPYELIYTHGDERLPPALTLTQPLSRSYFKMVEILEVMQTFQRTAKSNLKLRTAHVAEGPGGFIQAILKIAEDRHRQVLSAVAMTLKPNSAHVPGWRKAAAFLQKNRQVKIHYGADGTGDIYRPENQASFLEACQPGANLFTADGGFDFSIDYKQQEQKVFHLLLCSASIGLNVLRPGGDFVLKLFDCDAAHTKFLILLLARHFEDWTLYKPAMTRPCNSERYFLGRGFRGLSADAAILLQMLQEKSLTGEYPTVAADAWTSKELDYLQAHLDASSALQVLSIQLAIGLSKDPQIWFSTWHKRCVEKSYSWCEAFRVPAHPLGNHLKK